MRFFQQFMSRLLPGVQNTVSKNCVPLMTSDILVCLFSDLLPLSRVGPTSVLWVSWDKNEFLQQWSAQQGSQHSCTTPFSLYRRSHCWPVQPYLVPAQKSGSAGKYSLTFSNASKLLRVFFVSLFRFFFFLQKNAETALETWATTKALSIAVSPSQCSPGVP